ncbi:MAG: hypothetical protein FWC98_03120, partial [Bacteroidales bacterium]|nr:hypothetical protein [Bacteroidales bacterium]
SYYVRFADYQGSVRAVVRGSSNFMRGIFDAGDMVEVNNFDPWGVEFGRARDPFGMQPIKHQDMERLNFGNMNVHNHGARWAFNAVGRWLGMDPLMELFYSKSPYVFLNNNPVRFIDPDGRKAIDMEDLRDIIRTSPEPPEIPSQNDDPRDGGTLPEVTVTATRTNNALRDGLALMLQSLAMLGQQTNMAFGNNNASTSQNLMAGVHTMMMMAAPLMMTRKISTANQGRRGARTETTITPKITRQMARRGWTERAINNTVNNPYTTRVATNRATGQPATTFYTRDGAYVVRDNASDKLFKSVTD